MAHPLEQKMTQLARRWRLLLLLHGLGWLCACVVLCVVVLCLADYAIRFQDRGVRMICSLAALAAVGWASYRFLWPALTARTSTVRLAQQVEKRFPDLADRLASTMYFLSQAEDAPDAGSVTLRRAIVHQTTTETADLDLNAALDGRPTRMALIAAGIVAAVALGLFLASPGTASVALRRLALPWGADAWPQRTHLAFRTPVERIASGQNFEVEVIDRFGARLPENVWIEYRRQSIDGETTEQRQPATRLGEALFGRQEQVTRGFEYRAVGGDDYSMPWIALDVLESPAVEKLAVQLHYPAYTGWPAQAGDQQLRALVGTRVALTGAVSKPLREARLCRDGAEPVPLALNKDLHGFSLAATAEPGFVIEQTGSYWFELVDIDGLTGGTDLKYEIRALPDAPPTVLIEEPATDLHVTPQAIIPLKIAAKDDLAVATIAQLVDRSDHSDRESERTQLFAGPASVAASPAGQTGGSDAGDQRTIEQRWDLAQLELHPGTQLTLRAAASDYRPAETISLPRRITIITPEELDERLSEQQAFLAAELSRTLKLEQEARGQLAALEIQTNQVGRWNPADLDRLQNAEMTQRQIARSLTSKSDGLRSKVAGVLAELENNRLDRPDIAERMRGLSDDLDRLAREPLPAIERELTAARKQSQELGKGQSPAAAQLKAVAESLSKAGADQDEVITTLEKQVAELSQLDSYRQFQRDLGQLRRDQERVNEETAKLGRETLTKELAALTPQQRADLQKLGDEQQAIGRRFEKTEQQLQSAAERLAATDSAAAETLTDALRQARQANLAREMGEAGKNVGSNQIGQGVARQKQIAEELRELQDILSHRQESSLARLVEKLREAETELGGMRRRQAGLRKKAEEAQQEPNAAERKRQLERLAKEEQQLAEQAQALARRLERLQAQQAGQKAGSAASSLGKAGQAGSQGDAEQASAEAQQAERDLEQAEAEVAKSRRQAEMDLAFEQLMKMQQQLAALQGRQRSVVDEAGRLEGIRLAEGKSSRGQAESVGQLSREQRQVGSETLALAEKLSAAESFALTLRRAYEDMTRAAEKFDAQLTVAAAQRHAQNALRRLDMLLIALQPDAGEGEGKAGEGEGGGAGGGGGQSSQNDGIAEIAQLKLIKLLQQDLNLRTRELDDALGRQQSMSAEEQREYTQLGEEQGQLADLVRNMVPVAEPAPEDSPEQLPDVREDNRDLLPPAEDELP